MIDTSWTGTEKTSWTVKVNKQNCPILSFVYHWLKHSNTLNFLKHHPCLSSVSCQWCDTFSGSRKGKYSSIPLSTSHAASTNQPLSTAKSTSQPPSTERTADDSPGSKSEHPDVVLPGPVPPSKRDASHRVPSTVCIIWCATLPLYGG